jgi:hypothetical protein
MTTPTSRRTEALKLRQTISQLLHQVFAADNFNDMRGHVDRLGEIIADARGKQHVTADALPDKA